MKRIVGRGEQSGFAMVEFAFVLPLLALLLLMVVEFGRLFFQYNTLVQAARDAGRYAAGRAWDNNIGGIVLDDPSRDYDLRLEAKRVAIYGLPKSQAELEACESGASADGCKVLLEGLTEDDVSVEMVSEEKDPERLHVEVRISYTFVPIVGDGIPGFFGEDFDLRIPLVASTVMRAL